MQLPIALGAGVAALLLPTTNAKKWDRAKDATLISKIRTLTVQSSKKTTSRRTAPIPQLACVGGSAQGLYKVDVMQCANSGSLYDPEDIQWTCKSSLPPEFKLGSTDVVCEGFESPNDPFVLKGSCGVEYRLILTDLGVEKYGSKPLSRPYMDQAQSLFNMSNALSGIWSVLFWVVFIGVILAIASKAFTAMNQGTGRRRGGRERGWGGGGGGGGPDDDPPPPYTPRRPKSTSYSNTSRGYGGSGDSWRPGFWSGLAAGTGAGYLMGNRNGSSSTRPWAEPRDRSYEAGPSRYGGGSGGSSWGSGGTAPAPSSSRHESTGFGGTRRR